MVGTVTFINLADNIPPKLQPSPAQTCIFITCLCECVSVCVFVHLAEKKRQRVLFWLWEMTCICFTRN